MARRRERRCRLALLLTILYTLEYDLCYSHPGRAALFQPSSGGHVTITCRSEKIFQMLQTDNPVVKTILASVQAHSQKYRDAGLFMVLLTVKYVRCDSLPLRSCSISFFDVYDNNDVHAPVCRHFLHQNSLKYGSLHYHECERR